MVGKKKSKLTSIVFSVLVILLLAFAVASIVSAFRDAKGSDKGNGFKVDDFISDLIGGV